MSQQSQRQHRKRANKSKTPPSTFGERISRTICTAVRKDGRVFYHVYAQLAFEYNRSRRGCADMRDAA